MTEYSVQYGETTIKYQIRYANRKTLAIHVESDLTVRVVAPIGTELDDIAAKVQKRASWILRQQRDFEQYLPQQPPRKYVSGETHYYLGRRYRLKVISDEIDQVKLSRGYFFAHSTRPQDPKHTRELMRQWYRHQALRVLRERLWICFPRLNRYEVEYPVMELREMKTRWGSCTADGKILLNPVLVQVQKDYIDYIMLHELCHLVEHNHGLAFYALLGRVCPDWRVRREGLNHSTISV